MAKSFVVLYGPGESWVPDEPLSAQPLADHVAYLLDLHKAGHLIMGGPFADGTAGLVILRAEDRDHAQRLIANDPAVRDGILAPDINEWDRLV